MRRELEKSLVFLAFAFSLFAIWALHLLRPYPKPIPAQNCYLTVSETRIYRPFASIDTVCLYLD